MINRRASSPPRSRRAAAGVAVVLVLVLLQLTIVGAILASSNSTDLAMRRVEGARAEYAALAATNLALRELSLNADLDGNGAIGSVSAVSLLGASGASATFVGASSRTISTSASIGDAVRRADATIDLVSLTPQGWAPRYVP